MHKDELAAQEALEELPSYKKKYKDLKAKFKILKEQNDLFKEQNHDLRKSFDRVFNENFELKQKIGGKNAAISILTGTLTFTVIQLCLKLFIAQ